MKKIFILVATVFFSVLSFAQINLGLKAGANISTTKDLIACANNRLGYHFGTFLQKNFSKRFFVRPELLYSSKGDSFEPPFASHEGAGRFNYLNFPVLLGFQADDKLSLVAGPEFGYLIKSSIRYENSVFNSTKRYPRFDAGIDFGLSYSIRKNIGAELRYSYGFNTIFYTDPVGSRAEINGGHRVFQAGLYYLLHQ